MEGDRRSYTGELRGRPALPSVRAPREDGLSGGRRGSEQVCTACVAHSVFWHNRSIYKVTRADISKSRGIVTLLLGKAPVFINRCLHGGCPGSHVDAGIFRLNSHWRRGSSVRGAHVIHRRLEKQNVFTNGRYEVTVYHVELIKATVTRVCAEKYCEILKI